MLEEVLEVNRSLRNMVYHDIQHHAILPAEILDILPCAELRIYFEVVQRCKSAVPGRRIRRKDVNPAFKQVRKMLLNHLFQSFQVPAKRIRISDELSLISKCHDYKTSQLMMIRSGAYPEIAEPVPHASIYRR